MKLADYRCVKIGIGNLSKSSEQLFRFSFEMSLSQFLGKKKRVKRDKVKCLLIHVY